MSRKHFVALAVAFAMVATTFGTTAFGQAYLTAPESGYQYPVQQASASTMNFEQFEQRIQALEASLAEEKGAAEPQWIDAATQTWTSKTTGRICFDMVNVAKQDANATSTYGDMQNYSEVRSARIGLKGTGYGVYMYDIQVDVSPESNYTTQDASQALDIPFVQMAEAYIGMKDVPYLGTVLLGNQKAAFGLEWMTSSCGLTIMERPMASNFFGLGYRTGITQSNQFHDDSVLVQSGVYLNHSYTNLNQSVGDDQGTIVSLRSVWTPVYDLDGRSIVHIGGGWNHSTARTHNFAAFPGTHEGTQFLSAGSVPMQSCDVGNLELMANYNSFSIQSELFASSYKPVSSNQFNSYGGYVTGSYFLTGENRNYKRSGGKFGTVTPDTNFWIVDTAGGCDAGWGAWEVAARYDYIDMTQAPIAASTNIGGQVNSMTLGMNWYWNANARMMMEYIHATSSTNSGNWTTGSTSNEADILGMRFQVNF